MSTTIATNNFEAERLTDPNSPAPASTAKARRRSIETAEHELSEADI